MQAVIDSANWKVAVPAHGTIAVDVSMPKYLIHYLLWQCSGNVGHYANLFLFRDKRKKHIPTNSIIEN